MIDVSNSTVLVLIISLRLRQNQVTRGEARTIEQALIVENPGFTNKINNISPKHAYYDDAVSWGQAWLRRMDTDEGIPCNESADDQAIEEEASSG